MSTKNVNNHAIGWHAVYLSHYAPGGLIALGAGASFYQFTAVWAHLSLQLGSQIGFSAVAISISSAALPLLVTLVAAFALKRFCANYYTELLKEIAFQRSTDRDFWSVDPQNEEAIQKVLFAGADPNIRDTQRCTLLSALSGIDPRSDLNGYNPIELVKALLAAGADTEAMDALKRTPLLSAVNVGNLAVVEALVAAGANLEAEDVSYNPRTPLISAAILSQEEIVEALVAAGANLEAKDKQGWTSLHHVANEGNQTIVEKLLAAGANLEAKDKQGWTSLHHAANKGNQTIVEKLLAAGASADSQSDDDYTPLIVAVEAGELGVVEAMLKYKPNLDLQESADGYTALMAAVFGDQLPIVQALVTAGANLSIKNLFDETAVNIARTLADKRAQLCIDIARGGSGVNTDSLVDHPNAQEIAEYLESVYLEQS